MALDTVLRSVAGDELESDPPLDLPLAGDEPPFFFEPVPWSSLSACLPLYVTAATTSMMTMDTVPTAIMMRRRCCRAFSARRRSVSGPKSPNADDMVRAVFIPPFLRGLNFPFSFIDASSLFSLSAGHHHKAERQNGERAGDIREPWFIWGACGFRGMKGGEAFVESMFGTSFIVYLIRQM
jgi:hypothetical protein